MGLAEYPAINIYSLNKIILRLKGTKHRSVDPVALIKYPKHGPNQPYRHNMPQGPSNFAVTTLNSNFTSRDTLSGELWPSSTHKESFVPP